MIASLIRDRFADTRLHDIDDDARRVAVHCLIDWAGCTLAGSREPLSQLLRDEVGPTIGASEVVGTDMRWRPADAALVNGAAAHALDFDDTHTLAGGHVSAVVASAVLATAQDEDVDGEAFLTAFAVGAEVAIRLGAIIGKAPYRQGWHMTSIVGVVGAAAGVSRLMGLDACAFEQALGLAASHASGVKANFGTMTKPLHAGMAASAAVRAARLAARGYTANPDAVGGEQGLIDVIGGDRDPDRAATVIADRRWALRDTLFKFHASCYLTHAAIEATKAASSEGNGSRPESVRLTVNPDLLDVCAIAEPTTGLEGKFSLRACGALALLGRDTSDPVTFTDSVVGSDDVQRLLRIVDVTTDITMRTTQCSVEVRSATSSLHATHDSGVPAADLAAQDERLEAKFRAIVSDVLTDEEAEGLLTQMREIVQKPSVRSLFATNGS